ncbi:MAG: asparagine synthase (glutamine-hydrolyzing), partial [Candidatus Polarisedimenticolia bacterium]
MCGIAGILSLGDHRQVAAEEIGAMCAVLTHRGPDDEGMFLGPGVGLGMRRLSIIDLETGRQPMGNEDGTVRVVCNGEVYNFRELRRDLEARGHRFATASDTESVVHAYEEFGLDTPAKLRGMFGMAIWDARRRRLLLARDRLGIKPLYYAESGGRLAFASELKAILQVAGIERVLDWDAVDHLLASLTTPADRGIVRGVRKLPPGHLLVAEPGSGVRVAPYWRVRFEPDRKSREEDLAARLRDLLEESVRLHLASDVPLGAFLSGGLDSSAVVAAMTRVSAAPIKTFSIGFAEAGFDELPHARRVARAFGTEHHELVVRPDLEELATGIAWHLDEPFGDSSAIPAYLVSRLAAGHVKVVLTGDGGDELFGGYDKYLVEGRERRLERLAAPLRPLLGAAARLLREGARGRNLLHHFSLAGEERFLDAQTLFRRPDRLALLHPDVRAGLTHAAPPAAGLPAAGRPDGAGTEWLSRLQHRDLETYLPLDVLTKVDRMSMAHGLEARVPLLDHHLVEFAATVPPEMLVRGGITKHLFRRALQGVLPRETLERGKQGFAIPLGRWFRGPLAGFVREVLLGPRARQRGVFDSERVRTLIRRHDGGRDLGLHLWTLMSFELWCRAFL